MGWHSGAVSSVLANRSGLIQSSGYCLCGVSALALSMSVWVSFRFSSFISHFNNMPIGVKLLILVKACAWCPVMFWYPIQSVIQPHSQCVWNSVQTHQNLDQDEAVTEHKQLYNLHQLIPFMWREFYSRLSRIYPLSVPLVCQGHRERVFNL